MCFLRWMSPFWPEAVGRCPCCEADMCGEQERDGKGRNDGWKGERGVGVFL